MPRNLTKLYFAELKEAFGDYGGFLKVTLDTIQDLIADLIILSFCIIVIPLFLILIPIVPFIRNWRENEN